MKIKITIESKNCRLKITDAPYFVKIPVRLKISVRSENPYLKISVYQWANRPEWCKCSGHLKGLQAGPDAKQESHKGRAGEDAGTHDHRRRAGEPKQKYFLLYI